MRILTQTQPDQQPLQIEIKILLSARFRPPDEKHSEKLDAIRFAWRRARRRLTTIASPNDACRFNIDAFVLRRYHKSVQALDDDNSGDYGFYSDLMI